MKQNYEDLDLRYNQLKKNYDDCLKEKSGGSGTTEQCKSVHQVIVNKIKGDIGNLKGLIQGGDLGNTTKANLKKLVAAAEQEASKSNKANETISAIGPLVSGLAQELKRISSVGRRKSNLLEQCVRNYTYSSDKLNLCEKKVAEYLPDKKWSSTFHFVIAVKINMSVIYWVIYEGTAKFCLGACGDRDKEGERTIGKGYLAGGWRVEHS